MSFRSYIDASGKPEHGPDEWCVVAGFIASVEEWASFDQAWRDLLLKNEVQYLRMSALHARKPPFHQEKWTNEFYMTSFLASASEIVRSHVRMWAVDTVKNHDFSKAKSLRGGLAKYTNAYGLCGTAISLRLQMPLILKIFPSRAPVEHYFEAGDSGVQNIRRVFKRCGMAEPVVRAGKPTLNASCQGYDTPFQAADWLAFESRKLVRKYYPEKATFRPSLKALLRGVPGEAKVWTLEDLITFCDIKIARGQMKI